MVRLPAAPPKISTGVRRDRPPPAKNVRSLLDYERKSLRIIEAGANCARYALEHALRWICRDVQILNRPVEERQDMRRLSLRESARRLGQSVDGASRREDEAINGRT